MQSENGILLLFYIFLSHGNERKKELKGVGCKKGECCPQAPVNFIRKKSELLIISLINI
jgi:hypothetical protein